MVRLVISGNFQSQKIAVKRAAEGCEEHTTGLKRSDGPWWVRAFD